MATVPTPATAKLLRKRFGQYLKAHRMLAGLNQRALADILGMVYEQGISHPEQGRLVPAVDVLKAWAQAINVQPEEMAKKYLYFIEPEIYEMLYDEDPYAAEQLPRPERTRKAKDTL